MDYQYVGSTQVLDDKGNITAFDVKFTATTADNVGNLNGTVRIPFADFTATGGDKSKVNALIEPTVLKMQGATKVAG